MIHTVIQSEFYRQKRMLTMILCLLVVATSQQTANATLTNNVTVSIFSVASLSIYQSPDSPYYPSDFFINTQIASKCIYALASNNIVQIYQRADPSQCVQNFTNYSYRNSSEYAFVHLSVNEDETALALTSYSRGTLRHLVFQLSSSGIIGLKGIVGDGIFGKAPSKVFMKGKTIYSYFTSSTGNDSVYTTNSMSNTSSTQTLDCSSCDIVISPNHEIALVWSIYSRLYIYSIRNHLLILNHVYNQSVIQRTKFTEAIPFSSDSQLAILQTGTLNPVRLINLTDYSTHINITLNSGVFVTAFLDKINRFVFINTPSGSRIYDLKQGILSSLPIRFPSKIIQTDPESGLLYCFQDQQISVYGVNITDSATIISSYPVAVPSSSPNPSNTSTPKQNPPGDEQAADSEFFYALVFSEREQAILAWLQDKLLLVNWVIVYAFSVIFSSPLAVQFLTLFNYFSLCSLYVLANIRIPEIVFRYLAQLLESSSSNVLSLVGFSFSGSPVCAERVTDQRPLFFHLSSDIVSSNYSTFVILFANFVGYELLILLVRCLGKRFRKTRAALLFLRGEVYWGLTVSNMVAFLLPWKYSIMGGVAELPSKLVLGLQYLLLLLLPLLAVMSFVHELQKAKKKKKNRRLNVALKEWWADYENVVYPLLILVDSPVYFMVAIGCSNVVALINSFYAREYRWLFVLKAAYPVLFHLCFLVFMFCRSDFILVLAVVVCLAVLFVGSVHHLLETAVIGAYLIHKIFKFYCLNQNRIKPYIISKHHDLSTNTCKKEQQKTCYLQPTHLKNNMNIKEIIKIIDGRKTQGEPSININNDFINLNQKQRRKPLKRVKKTKDTISNQIIVNPTKRVNVTLVYQ